jgi:predicted permease
MPDWRRYRDFFGPNPERDLADEVRFHLETEIEDLVAAGVSPDDARSRALARFGDVARFVAECRASDGRRLGRQRRARLLDVIRQDARYSVRGLVRRPAFAVTTILVLAIGVGANAAVFSIVDHLFLRPPAAVNNPAEVKRIFVSRRNDKGADYFQVRFSLPEARLIDSAVSRTFPSTIFFRRDLKVELDPGVPRTLSSAWVSPTYFSVLGVRLFAGTAFGTEAARFGVPAASAIISWTLWQRTFAAEPNVIGRVIRVDGRPVTIRGIAPRGFSGIDVDMTDIWLPLAGFAGFGGDRDRPWYDDWGRIAFRVLARVPAGGSTEQLVTSVQAGVRASTEARRITNPRGKAGDAVLQVIPAPLLTARGPEHLSQRETIAAVLAGLAFLLLVIAIANVASLLVGRALDRQRETAVRVALGMDRLRIYSQIAVESLILAGAATIAASIAATWVGAMLRKMVLPGVDFANGPMDARIALLALSLGLGAALLAALVPLGSSLRVDLTRALKTSNRDGGARRSRSRAVLVGVQAALSVVLLVGTGLLGRSLYNIRTVHMGLDVNNLIIVKAREDADASASGRVRLEDVATLARSLPGVTAVSLAAQPPLWDQFEAQHLFTVQGDTVPESHVGYVAADAAYLGTVGTRVVQGRDFTREDRLGAAPVMIVSEELARRVWVSRTPLGGCLRVERADDVCRTIVGVAENAHTFAVVEEPLPVFYIPLDQHGKLVASDRAGVGAVVVRVPHQIDAVAARLRVEVGDTATTLRDRQVIVLSEILAQQYGPWETGARLFAGLAALALMLALLGLYGVLNYLVTLRAREFGVRIALGATRRQLLAHVVRDAVRHITIGAVVGLAIALMIADRVRSLLYGVSPHDPPVLVAAIAVLVIGAALAAVIPGRRAMDIDAMTAIREE